MGAPNRRTIYQASLEAYVDRLHEKLLAKKLFPVPLDELKPWEGLNNKTARVSDRDAASMKLLGLTLDV